VRDETRLPPHNKAAEQQVLGAMLRHNETIPDAVGIVSKEDFCHDAHQKIFQAIIELSDKGVVVDTVLLANRLNEHGQIEDVGGYVYLAELWDCSPTGANVEHHAKLVRGKAILRHTLQASLETARDVQNQTGPPEELLEAAQSRFLALGEKDVGNATSMIQELVDDSCIRLDERCERRRGGGHVGVQTGFGKLDYLLTGLPDSELIVVAARPGTGKTAFGLNVARHVVLYECLPVLFVSVEQSKGEITDRILCAQGLVDAQRIRRGTINDEECSRFADAADRMRDSKLFVDGKSRTMTRIAANARRHKFRHGIRLVIVDYLQLIEPENKKEPRQEQVAGISRRLKYLAKDLKIPVMALAQLNRQSENSGKDNRPRLSHLRESGSIEQDADTVLLLHRPGGIEDEEDLQRPPDDGLTEVVIAKQRNGPTGIVKVRFRKEFQRFESWGMD